MNSVFLGSSSPSLLGNGSAGAPSLAFASEPTLGFYRTGADSIKLMGQLAISGSLQVGNASLIYWAGRSNLSAPAGAQLNLTNDASSIGIGLDAATDAILKIRTRAQTGYATIDALAYQVSGVAGASFGPAAPASITVVNGIVTAAS